jgi:acyl-CoA thioester hydrolase
MGILTKFRATYQMNGLCINPTSSPVAIEGVPHDAPFQCTITIQEHQSSNEVEHVNNIEYLRWIDKGAQLHCDDCEWTRERLLGSRIMWFVARHEIDYRSEAIVGDALLLTTWVDDVRRVKSWRTSQIHALGETPRLVCECKTLWVLVDLDSRRPTAIPKELATALQSLRTPRLAHP